MKDSLIAGCQETKYESEIYRKDFKKNKKSGTIYGQKACINFKV